MLKWLFNLFHKNTKTIKRRPHKRRKREVYKPQSAHHIAMRIVSRYYKKASPLRKYRAYKYYKRKYARDV